ncbi:MAG: bifunctional phosphoglucose/phosphomannose isomerase [Candidatus Woesearchaeota archaeon]
MDEKIIEEIDIQNYIKDLEDYPYHLLEAYDLARGVSIKGKFDKIVVSGMGGSGISGDILKVFMEDQSPVPVFVNKSYDLPKYVNDKTLMFIISYSGNTEETIDVFKKAIKTGCEIAVITSGGKLKELAQMHQTKLVLIPGNHQPRASMGFLLVPILRILENSGAISDMEDVLKKIASNLKNEMYKKKAEELAKNIQDKIPLIYTSDKLYCIALRWKTQFNENTKIHAFWNVFSEMNHNEIVGYTKLLAKHHMIIISSDMDHPRIRKRFQLVKNLVKEKGVDVTEMSVVGDNLLHQMLSAIYIGDWTSYFLSILYRIDPSPVDIIENLKKDLKK